MIIEHALLHVRPDQSAAFESAMQTARSLITPSPGFRFIEVRPALEAVDHYLLLVGWDDVESHREGFRRSDRYESWRKALHGFFDPMPTVSYFGESIFND